MNRSSTLRSQASMNRNRARCRPHIEGLEERSLPGSILSVQAGGSFRGEAATVRIVPANRGDENAHAGDSGRITGAQPISGVSSWSVSTEAPVNLAAGGVGQARAAGQTAGLENRRSWDYQGHIGKAVALIGFADLNAGLPDPVVENGLDGSAADVRSDTGRAMGVLEAFAVISSALEARFELGGSGEAAPVTGNRTESTDLGPGIAPTAR